MASDGYGLGYERVDADPHVPFLVSTMEVTARWEATRALRAWGRAHLQLALGQRLLDVGCGLGEAALVLAEDVGPSGHVVGVDVSIEMLHVARAHAATTAASMSVAAGDALRLPHRERSVDAARCERTLQWLADPQVAIAELVRVLRPGGRLCLIDTDWSTLRLEVGDPEVTEMVAAAMATERGRPSNIGRRLDDLVRIAGLRDVVATQATQTWTGWDPDASPTPPGLFSMRSLADDLVEREHLRRAEADAFVDRIHDAARLDQLSMALTMFAVVATKP